MVKAELVRRFSAGARAAGAEVVETRDRESAAGAVVELLRKERIDSAVVSPPALDFGGRIRVIRPGIVEEYAAARAGIVRADYGVAETGTLVHLDADDEEKLAWTLPPLCVCLLDTGRIVPELEALTSVFAGHLRGTGKPGPQVSLVTGPSRTADIECELTIGVQGPSRVVIILFEATDS